MGTALSEPNACAPLAQRPDRITHVARSLHQDLRISLSGVMAVMPRMVRMACLKTSESGHCVTMSGWRPVRTGRGNKVLSGAVAGRDGLLALVTCSSLGNCYVASSTPLWGLGPVAQGCQRSPTAIPVLRWRLH